MPSTELHDSVPRTIVLLRATRECIDRHTRDNTMEDLADEYENAHMKMNKSKEKVILENNNVKTTKV